MSQQEPKSRELELLESAEQKSGIAKYAIFARLSGPGWLQGAVTLGGGSLAGALYLGVIMGYHLMWLQPVAIILGVIMLSAISYVTLATEKRPFDAVKEHVSPALAWGWLIATLMANIVWCLPQFALGTAALKQNLIPSLNTDAGTWYCAFALLAIATTVVWFYNSGGWGIRMFELILKAMVGIVVICFFGVVIAMTIKGTLPWGQIFSGLIPNPRYLFEPVPSMTAAIESTGESADYWRAFVANAQKDKIITAFATAVGINMTFLLPYSMLRKGWGRPHRELAIFDLSIGLIIPFVLATGCVVIAASSQFHAKSDDVLAMVADADSQKSKEVKDFNDILDKRIKAKMGDKEYGEISEKIDGEVNPQLIAARAALPEAERKFAAMLAARDNLALAKTLAPLFPSGIAQFMFGAGVLGMALSTIIILMLINGFAFCEMIGVEPKGTMHRLGSLIPAVGVLGPFYWSKAAAALATPTSVIGGAMLPIAYVSFLLLLNSKKLLGEAMPTGFARLRWNVLMVCSTVVASFASAWGLFEKKYSGFPIGKVALGALAVLLVIGIVSFIKKNQANESQPT